MPRSRTDVKQPSARLKRTGGTMPPESLLIAGRDGACRLRDGVRFVNFRAD